MPLLYQAPTTAQPDQGVRPDHEIRCHRQAIADGTDEVLQYAVQALAPAPAAKTDAVNAQMGAGFRR
ncbi:hypothetical protein [Hymenobacter sp. BRD67]|uniref:hypothetical protein n=1 Tax=Hymenobacter sp. BRD67 TaxID=2675877 RepID=UPI00156701C8|nr:hypothetical protein [Hymenobacter sp. BRD67]QKG51951.1 hypothetical protein GKZ67_04170 [Hymenobacter sp. BRD67]